MFNFELTLDEANFILGLLGKQPYDNVAALILKIKQQAEPQLPRVQREIEDAKAKENAENQQPA